MNKQLSGLDQLITSDYHSVAGVVILKNGELQYERYFNGHSASSPVHLFSVTKSIVSLLIGIAIDKGYIKGVDQKVLDFFPDYVPQKGEKTIQTVTLRNMLTMTAPIQYNLDTFADFFASGDWVTSSLDLLGGTQPVGKFHRMSVIGPDILSGILVQATGQPLLDFARESLFTPLEITVGASVPLENKEAQIAFLTTKGVSGWAADPKGINTGGWGLALTTMDMAKIGQLCLNGGVWEGQRIVSAAWIEESTKEQSRWEARDLPFGYQWWASIANGYAAMGDSGNVIYVSPQTKTVVSIASLGKSSGNRIKLVVEHIEPAVSNL